MFRPASRQISTSRVASATSLDPQALKNSLPPPNVPVPKLKTGTLKPEFPSCRYSIAICLLFCEGHSFASFTDAVKRRQTRGTRRQAPPGPPRVVKSNNVPEPQE